MPSTEANLAHVAFTDHYIRVHYLYGPETEIAVDTRNRPGPRDEWH